MTLDVRPYFGYIPSSCSQGTPSRGYSLRRSGSGSRGRSYDPRPGGFGHRPSGLVAGPRGARCTGAGEGPPVCTRRFQEARPGAESRVTPRRSAAVERREASAPARARAARQMVCAVFANLSGRCGFRWMRLPALRLLSFCGWFCPKTASALFGIMRRGGVWTGFLTVAWHDSDAGASRER